MDDLEHVLRPQLPWRDEETTECGKDTADVTRTITRDAFVAKVRTQGKQRSAMTTCMTCWTTASRHRSWAESPADVVLRSLKRTHLWSEDPRADTEVRALAALVAAHREEFDAYIAGVEQTVDLSAARRARRRG